MTNQEIAAECAKAVLSAKRQAEMNVQTFTLGNATAVIAAVLDRLGVGAKKPRKSAVAAPEADQVYALYPRKLNPADAKIAITKALKTRDLAYLLDKTNQFRMCVESWPVSYRYTNDGRDLCPYPASWFNSGGYDSDPREWKRFGARKAAEHMQVSPPEPVGWRAAFPDFTDRDKPWNRLQPAQQEFIIKSMAMANTTTELPLAIKADQNLREA